MIIRGPFPLLCVFLLSACAHFQPRKLASNESPNTISPESRVGTRTFPSIFQAWAPAQNFNETVTDGQTVSIKPMSTIESAIETLARHDLVWQGATSFHLQWNNPDNIGLSTGFTDSSIAQAVKLHSELMSINPQMILLSEIRYHDGPEGYIPMDSPWWMRDSQGARIPAKKTVAGTWYLLDYNNPEFQDQVALQCQAVVQRGALDGCMFDWWSKDDMGRVALIKKIRAAIGDTAIIVVNVNQNRLSGSAPYINGMYMEGMLPKSMGGLYDWKVAAQTLLWAKGHLKSPSFTALDAWAEDPAAFPSSLGRNHVSLMRFATTLSLTHSDGYVLFADPNGLPTPDHLHDWYPIWSKSLGRPLSPPGQSQADGTFVRDFTNGRVICNPPENTPAHVHFDSKVTSQASAKQDTDFSILPGDGDIFLQ